MTTEDVYDATISTPRDYYLTQIEVMKSRDYAERLVRVLNLSKHPDFDPRQRVAEKSWWATLVERVAPSQSKPALQSSAVAGNEDEIREAAIARVMGGISISSTRNTQLVKVNFSTHDPDLAERVPNTLAMIYIVADLESKSGSAKQSMAFLSEQADKLKSQLADSEKELQQYRESQKMVVTKGLTLSEATRKLENLTASLEDARRKRHEAEQVFNQVTAAARGQSNASF